MSPILECDICNLRVGLGHASTRESDGRLNFFHAIGRHHVPYGREQHLATYYDHKPVRFVWVVIMPL